ncbi:hypothetical protein BDR22DRAFT_31785 [Usnea florida]
MGDCAPPNSSSCMNPPELQPNPDISGIGILIGFAASAWFTFGFCIAYYLINNEDASNTVDIMFLDKRPERWRRSPHPTSKAWSEALQGAVLAFSDLQVMTGVAILISAYSQISCGLQYYHWQIAVDLALFSSITHLTTLTCLRRYFQKRRALRIWRLVCMVIIGVLLSVALGSTGYPMAFKYNISWEGAVPAWCLFQSNFLEYDNVGYAAYDWPYTVILLGYLAVSYISRAIQLFPESTRKAQMSFRPLLGKACERWLTSLRNRALKSRSLFWVFMHNVLLSVYCAFKATADLYGSILFEITWLTVLLAWGTITIIQDRASGGLGPSGDNGWAFGQVIALVLLFLPFLSFVEVSYDAVKSFSGPSRRHGILIGTPGGVTAPLQHHGPALPYEGFEKCGWYRKMTLLIYFLSLVVAGVVLYSFPYQQNTSMLSLFVLPILYQYLQYFALNCVIVLLFASIALQWPVCNQCMFSRKKELLTSDDLLGLMLPNQKLDIYRSVDFSKGSKGWTILACVGALVSLSFEIWSILTSIISRE